MLGTLSAVASRYMRGREIAVIDPTLWRILWLRKWKKEEMERKNVNRGYRKLTVWQDAVAYYAATCETFRSFSFVLQRVASQAALQRNERGI